VSHKTKYREATENWINGKFQFGDAIFLTVHYSDYLQEERNWTRNEVEMINKRFLRELEARQKIKGGKDRLKRLVVIEGKTYGRKHTHMIIEKPTDKTAEQFDMDIWLAVNGTKGMRNSYSEEVYEQLGLVNYLTKESNYNIDNIDTKNSRV
jgi:hypothetical protein|tara:strand:+ start:1477 stop:1932 length:456 start_codon:yes stop_codon:yes gene_type:complete